MGKVINLPARWGTCSVRPPGGDPKWVIYVSRDVEAEGVESRGDNELMVYARSIERVSALIAKGKKLLAREKAVRAAAERKLYDRT